VKIAILKLLGAVLVVATVTVVVRDSRSAARARRPVIERVSPPPPEVAEFEQRTRVKSHLARRIIAERIPLLEAVELFAEVNGEEGTASLILSVPGRSVREKLCRQVILYVVATENEMEKQGHVWTGTRASEELQAERDRLLAAGALPPDPEVQ
jgi:hypothetical protein